MDQLKEVDTSILSVILDSPKQVVNQVHKTCWCEPAYSVMYTDFILNKPDHKQIKMDYFDLKLKLICVFSM